jgi:hypothetical protein
MKFIDLTGKRFSRLVVVKKDRKSGGKFYWFCKCDCGINAIVSGSNLKTGHTKSCGCFQIEEQSKRITETNLKHGHNCIKTNGKPSPTYNSWQAMFNRCYNPKHISYNNYGARGITVWKRWNSFINFLADMGERPDGKTLDRINVNGNYDLFNCKWSTLSEQQRNRRDNSNV